MKAIHTYTPNELKTLAHLNFHNLILLLEENNIKPLVQRTDKGGRTVSYYGGDAYDFVMELNKKREVKKAAELQRRQERAARIAAGLPVKGGRQTEERKKILTEFPFPPEAPVDTDTGPSLRELVKETNDLLRQMLEFWKGN